MIDERGPEFVLQYFTHGIARQGVQDNDLLWNLIVGEAILNALDDVGSRRRMIFVCGNDEGNYALAEVGMGRTDHRRLPHGWHFINKAGDIGLLVSPRAPLWL
jgi:hypothetical protein